MRQHFLLLISLFLGVSPLFAEVSSSKTSTNNDPCIETSGYCGAEITNVEWELSCDGVLTLSGTGATQDNSSCSVSPWDSYTAQITSVIVKDGITTIGPSLFFGRRSWHTTIYLSSTIQYLGKWAFRFCAGISSFTCVASTPPALGDGVFLDMDLSAILLYVPSNSIKAYKTASQWKEFTHIQPIPRASKISTAEVTTTPVDETTVLISWPEVENAETYEIAIILDADTVRFLTFDTDGLLHSDSLAMQLRKEIRQDARANTHTTDGWQYAIIGLEENKNYVYSLTVKNAEEVVLLSQTVEFATPDPQAIDYITNNPSSTTTKILHNGQILILRGEKMYTIQGQEVNP